MKNVSQTSMLHTALAAWLLVALWAQSAHSQVLTAERAKNSLELLIAFQPLVAEARLATVQVLVDQKQVALGTIVDSNGYLVTKASELSGPASCRLFDGRVLPARVIGIRQDFDLALLKIEARGLKPVQWSDRREPAVGQWLASVGLEPLPLSAGVVSVVPRSIPAEHGVLGIVIAETRKGPRISAVVPNSGADRAGLEKDDVITHVGGQPVQSGREVTAAIRERHPGDVLALRILRGEQSLELNARLGAALSDSVSRAELDAELDGELSTRRAGFPSALEHDSVLRPADCGGPVVDLSGAVVAVNIARAGRAESLAIPARNVQRVVAELRAGR